MNIFVYSFRKHFISTTIDWKLAAIKLLNKAHKNSCQFHLNCFPRNEYWIIKFLPLFPMSTISFSFSSSNLYSIARVSFENKTLLPTQSDRVVKLNHKRWFIFSSSSTLVVFPLFSGSPEKTCTLQHLSADSFSQRRRVKSRIVVKIFVCWRQSSKLN